MSAAPRLAHAVVGFSGGCCVGLVGWGGSQIVVPGLTHPAFGSMTQVTASAVSVSSQSVAAAVQAANYLQADAVDLQVACSIALPSLLGARGGVALARRLQPEVLSLIFNGGGVLLLPINFFVQRWRQQREACVAVQTASIEIGYGRALSTAAACAFGLGAGAVSALMGVGGGPLAVSFLSLTTELPHHLVQGTASAAVVPGMLASSAFYAMHGSLPMATVATVTAGAVVGSTCGAQAALHMSGETLRGCYMASLVLLGGRSCVAAGRNLVRILRQTRG